MSQQNLARRTIATRVLLSFGVTLLAFAVTVGWSVLAQRRAARDADDLTNGLVPIALKLGQLRATQTTLSTLVEGSSDERDPLSARLVLGTLVNVRHAKLLETRAAIVSMQQSGSTSAQLIASDLVTDLDAVGMSIDSDKGQLDKLFGAMEAGDKDGINRELVTLGAMERSTDTQIHQLSDKVQTAMDTLSEASEKRTLRSIWALALLAVLTFAVGVGVTLHVRRLLGPLVRVTERARSVARGDLEPRPVEKSNDEIGELASTFETMVEAVARAQSEALANERLAAIGKMAAHVTHEIRNPLSSIGLNLEMLNDELKTEEARQLASAIGREVQRLELLSEEYLRVARLPSPRMEADDVAAVIEEIADFTKQEMERAGCKVVLDVKDDLPPALFDEAQLRQALLNLLRNAREASTDGGTIDVTVRAEGMSVVISVLDRGAGIPDEIRERVFEPFFSTKGEGTGLGLAITRHIVEAHGGSITCAAREGGGTVFRIALPIAPARSTAVPSAHPLRMKR
jgi:signal transduction histidine kinase